TIDGGELHENLYNLSEKDKSYDYTIHKMPFPAREVSGTISVKEDNGGSIVSWEARVYPLDEKQEKELEPMFQGIYEASLETLRQQFESA
ncbi:SRPBCC family protein, partial [Candidatus Saccharibacteria bacterium]|nr:SRPBCC family protein [Candidatus Saccharibacteria bacterium]